MKCTTRWSAILALITAAVGNAGTSHAVILPVPVSYSVSSEFGSPYVAAALFDGTVGPADLNNTIYGASGDNQWAGVGPGPHQLFMDYGSSVSAAGLAYAQRQGAILGDNDKVGAIELWFSDASFGGSLPATAPQAIVHPIVPEPNTGVLVHYSLGGVHSGRYVAANFVPLNPGISPNNIGGSELRLTTVPEPGSTVAAIAGTMLAVSLFRLTRRC